MNLPTRRPDHDLFTSRRVLQFDGKRFSHCFAASLRGNRSHNRRTSGCPIWSSFRRFCQALAEPPFAVISKVEAASLSSLLSKLRQQYFFGGKILLSRTCVSSRTMGESVGHTHTRTTPDAGPFSILLPRKETGDFRAKTGTPGADGNGEERARAESTAPK